MWILAQFVIHIEFLCGAPYELFMVLYNPFRIPSVNLDQLSHISLWLYGFKDYLPQLNESLILKLRFHRFGRVSDSTCGTVHHWQEMSGSMHLRGNNCWLFWKKTEADSKWNSFLYHCFVSYPRWYQSPDKIHINHIMSFYHFFWCCLIFGSINLTLQWPCWGILKFLPTLLMIHEFNDETFTFFPENWLAMRLNPSQHQEYSPIWKISKLCTYDLPTGIFLPNFSTHPGLHLTLQTWLPPHFLNSTSWSTPGAEVLRYIKWSVHAYRIHTGADISSSEKLHLLLWHLIKHKHSIFISRDIFGAISYNQTLPWRQCRRIHKKQCMCFVFNTLLRTCKKSRVA